MLKDENSSVRSRAAQILGELREKEAITTLIDLLGDENRVVRLTAAHALGKLGDPSALGPLGELSRRESGFGNSVTVKMAQRALLGRPDHSWVRIPGLDFAVEIGIEH